MKAHSRHRDAFTLIELLVVIVIVLVLTGVAVPVYSAVQLSGRRTQSLSNIRQLGNALLAYCSDNNGAFPLQGDSNPTWSGAAANTPAETNAWYNILPRSYAGSKGLGDYAPSPISFYNKASLFYVPAATYPNTKLSTPQFAVAFNSKIETSSVTNARLSLFGAPGETVIFQESGLPGETVIKGQKAYTNQASSYASRTVARYRNQTILAFADGHTDLVTGTDVVDPSTGKAYFPPKTTGPTIYWSMDPANSPN